jgi:hypothetical protein
LAYGDQHFRHELRNFRNSMGLALRAYEISDDQEQIELLDMIVQTVDQVLALFDANDPDAPASPIEQPRI